MHLARVSLFAIVALAATAAHSQVIDGGVSWDGWAYRGQSNDLGIYGSDSTDVVYSLYTTTFLYNGQTVSGSPLSGMDLSGFQTGDRILGVGIEGVSGLPTFTGSGVWPVRPFIKFDLNSDSYSAASTVGGSDGRTSGGTYVHVGDFTLQMNGDNNNAYRTNSFAVYTDNGTFWGGTGAFTQFGGNGQTAALNVYPHIRSFFDPANGSWQAIINLDSLQSLAGIGTIDNEFRIVTAVNGTSGMNQSVLDIQAVPEPSTVLLLSAGALGLLRRKKNRNS